MSCLTEPNSIAVVACWADAWWSSLATWWQAHAAEVWLVLCSVVVFCLFVALVAFAIWLLDLEKVPRYDKK